jgi:large repetitive protein
VTIAPLVGDAETGGAPILSYALQQSSNTAAAPAAFEDVSGASGDSLALQHTVYGVQKGGTYAFRFRGRNRYGWSEAWSPTLYVTAGDAPAAPRAPTLVSATDSAVTVALSLPADDGGLPVQGLELLRDDGDQDGAPIDVLVASYDPYSFSLQHELTTTLDGIVSGRIYSFATRATNAKGVSELSGRLQAAVASPPSAPAAPTVDRSRSGETSLLIRWAAVPDDPSVSPGGDLTGYELLMAGPESGEEFSTVLDSVGVSTQTTELLVGPAAFPLSTGGVYRFKLALHNFNGAGLPSEISTFRVCAPPSGLAKPFKVGSATAPALSITVGWREPASSGGCPILGYAVFVDDGAAGPFVEANTADDHLVRGQPTLRQLMITRVSAPGATYRVQVTAFTEAGEVTSPALGVVLASPPLKPPTPVLLESTSGRTALDISGFPSSSDGGCPITSFDIQRDDGRDGAFQSLVGLSSPYLMDSLTVVQSQATPIARGRTYKFRYRARNCVGWGPLSDELQALAADPPLAPPSPTRASTSATSITLLLYPTRDNGGSAVTGYELYRDEGDGGAAFAEVTSYDYQALGFQVTLVLSAESMTPGRFYQFQFRARNVKGDSPFSAVATFPVADPPAKPSAAPWRISSTKLQITVGWERAQDTEPPAGTITGHYLYMDDGAGGDFSLVFSGSGYPDLTQYSVTGAAISTGALYRFYLVSENAVGLSAAASDISAFRACEAPSGLAPPTRVATSESSVSVAWLPPADDGGCSVTGYALFVGDEALAGPGDALSYVEVHAADVRDRPSLNSFTVTALPSGVAPGASLRFKLAAFNQGGFSATSERSLRVILATVPSAPAAAAASDPAVTSSSVIKVTYSAPASDGGSPISNYEVQMDDGVGGGFQTVAGGDGDPYLKHYFIAQGGGVCSYAQACEIAVASYGLDGGQYTQVVTSMALVKGRTYRLRYRAANAIGWSDWSPVSFVQAAKEPEAPPAPTVLSSSAGAIVVRINPALENNGAAIDRYGLYVDGGSLGSAYQMVSAYDGLAETYTLTAADGIASGERYRVVTTAWNVHGESPQSQEAWAAAGAAPAQPAPLRRAAALSTRTQIVVEWSVEPDTELPVSGYVLEWDRGEGEGVFVELWNGRGRPEVLSFAVSLTTGRRYSFRHMALNFNGESPYSAVLEASACESPSPPGRPTWVTSSLTTITLAWERSVDDGGCPVLEYRLFRDAGDGSGLTDVEVQAGDLRGDPLATGAGVTELPAGAVGQEFVFRLKVYTDFSLLETADGVWGEPSAAILLADVPGRPASGPRRGALSGATVVAADVDPVTETNGSPV